MKNAVFIHDHNFIYNKLDGKYYDGSGGAFDEKLWSRYLKIFDNLTVVGRLVEKLPNKLVLSSSKNVKFNLIENFSGFRNFFKKRKNIKKELARVISINDFAIIRLPSTLGAWAYEICIQQNKKFVLEIVGDPFEAYWYHGHWAGKIMAPYEMLKLKSIVRNADNVIYVTQRKLQERYPSQKASIGISNVRLMNVVNVENVSSFYNRDYDKIKIGLIGSFHVKYKGHVEALNALKFLVDTGLTNLELNLVGTGDPSWVIEMAENLGISDKVKIIGSIEAGEKGIFPFLDQIYLYIHPSKTEGLPRVILEAMSRGKMCLGSDVGGTNELLEEKFIHTPGNWRALSFQIREILKLEIEERIEIALQNRLTAYNYLEETLQANREKFIKR